MITRSREAAHTAWNPVEIGLAMRSVLLQSRMISWTCSVLSGMTTATGRGSQRPPSLTSVSGFI